VLTTDQGIRVLGPADLEDFLGLTALDPVVNVFADYRARTTNLDPRWLGGEMWGRYDDAGRLRAACHVGANLVPVQCAADDAEAFGARALARPRSVSTIVGPHPAVETLWGVVEEAWGEIREARWHQPHLVIDGPPNVDPDPAVRRTVRADLSVLYPACVAMYEEEVGISPELGGGREMYRARVLQLITRGWSFARFDNDDELMFKAEVASVSPSAAQIQGVWVPPALRGRGIATAGLAAVVETTLASIAPAVSLYVNEWNAGARRVYERIGFRETERFSTIMF